MVDQLDTEEVVEDDVIDETPVEKAEEGSELATDSPVEGEENTDEGDQEKRNKGFERTIDRLTGKRREAEEAAQSANLRATEAEEKLAAMQPELTIPPMPDQFDDDFAEKMEVREAALIEQTRREVAKTADDAKFVQQQAQQAETARKGNQEIIDTYFQRGVNDLGLTKTQMDADLVAIGDFGLSFDVLGNIAKNKEGPLINAYLAKHPDEVQRLSGLDSIDAVAELSNIRAKAVADNGKTSQTPDPTKRVDGGGVVRKDNPEGFTYE